MSKKKEKEPSTVMNTHDRLVLFLLGSTSIVLWIGISLACTGHFPKVLKLLSDIFK